MQEQLQREAAILGFDNDDLREWRPHLAILYNKIVDTNGVWGREKLPKSAQWEGEFLNELPKDYDEEEGPSLPSKGDADDWEDEPPAKPSVEKRTRFAQTKPVVDDEDDDSESDDVAEENNDEVSCIVEPRSAR